MNRRAFLRAALSGAAFLASERAVRAWSRYNVAIPLIQQGGDSTPRPTSTPRNTSTPIMQSPTPSETPSGTVYRTTSGTKYHRFGCSYLHGAGYAVSCATAIMDGLTACSVCDPMCDGEPSASPTPGSTATPREFQPTPTGGPDGLVYVWKTGGGTRYHTGNCRYVNSTSVALTCAQAVNMGLHPCSVCNPPICGGDYPTLEPGITPTATFVPDSVWCNFVIQDGYYHVPSCQFAEGGHMEDWEYINGQRISRCPVCRPECENGTPVPEYGD